MIKKYPHNFKIKKLWNRTRRILSETTLLIYTVVKPTKYLISCQFLGSKILKPLVQYFSHITSLVKNVFLDKLLDFIFPSFCISCGKKETLLCDECLIKIPYADKPDINIFPVFQYQDKIIREAIWQLKYKHHEIISGKLAQAIYDRLLEELPDLETFDNFKEPILIPIPLSKQRLKQRGFNQSELLIKKMSFIDSSLTSLINVLYKIKDTPSQTSIKDKNKRRLNIKNCFIIKNPEKIKNKNIILIDDVTTTGTTINEARKVLLKAGAKKVIAFTIAH